MPIFVSWIRRLMRCVWKWYMMRDLRNEITYNYDNDEETVVNILNTIEMLKNSK